MKKNNLSDGPSVSAPFANSKLGSTLVELLQGGSTAQKQLAEFILRNPMRMTAANIEDVSALAGVSPATISRFARELGFDSFAEMRSALADALLAVLAPVDKLRKTMAAAGHDTERGGTLDAARKQLALLDAADVERQCSRAAERIAAARSVHIMGFGLSAHIAGLATLGLQPFHPAVASVVEYGGTEVAAGRLMAIGKPDLLFAITFPRYAHDVIALTRFARDRGATVIGLTDSVASPISSLAHELILAPADHAVMSSSMVATVAIIEVIVTRVMLSDPRNVGHADRLTDAIAAYLHYGPRG